MSKYRIVEVTKNDKVSYMCQYRRFLFFWVDGSFKLNDLHSAKERIKDWKLEDAKTYRKVVYYGKA